MSGYADLLKFLKLQQEESRLQRILETKGYANVYNGDFGLNQWTSCLISRGSHTYEETQEIEIEQPDHLVSFLAIPTVWHEDCMDSDSEDLQQWFSGYKWQYIPGVNTPFQQGGIQACSEGLLLPNWLETPKEGWLKAFLMIRRDAICEYGIGQDAYSYIEKSTAFHLIQIVGWLWQFLMFINDLYCRSWPNESQDILIILNMRGTGKAQLGNLAKGWWDPIIHHYDANVQRCLDQHLQIQRKISSRLSENEIQDNVRWFATRIDNAWGQLEPRCYVNKKTDASQPFAYRGAG